MTLVFMAQSVSVLTPYFDGKNYAYWKVRMRAFLKSLDERVWVVVDKAWNRPTTNIDTWSKDKLNACNWNNKGVNTIFMVVSPDEFERISMCQIAKNCSA